MAPGARSNPNYCANASNPYHECTQACLQPKTKHSISKPHPHKTHPSTSDKGYGPSVTDAGKLGKKVNQERRKYAGCPKASNPYHSCDDNCNRRLSSASGSGGTPLKYETKKKPAASSSKPEPPVIDNVPASKVGAIYLSDASSSNSSQKKHISDEHIPTVEQPHSGEIHHVQDVKPASLKDQLNEEEDKVIASSHHHHHHQVNPITYVDEGVTKSAAGGSADSSFSGFPQSQSQSQSRSRSRSNEDSDHGETQESVMSESSPRIAVGGYQVKESFAAILRCILDKYGDIGASCHLESVVMRSYYVECVCFVVHELQSASIIMHYLTKSKLNELSAILKDVESAELRVPWLRRVLDQVIHQNQQDDVQEAKANSDREGEVESLREELESQLETLARKEQEVSDIKTRIIPEIRDRLSQLELKSSDLDNTMLSIKSTLGNLHTKSLIDELLLL